MTDQRVREALLLELHKSIDEAADAFLAQLHDPSPAYPPGASLTQDEISALHSLSPTKAASSGLRKLVADACSQPLFHLLSLMDGVVDPHADLEGTWLGLSLVPRTGDDAPMLHDELFESYEKYKSTTS